MFQKAFFNLWCISVMVDLSLKSSKITFWQHSPKDSWGVSTAKQHLLLAEQTESDSHSDRSGNGEQTALLLNTLFLLLLSTEFSHNTTTWKESTSDNHHPGLSRLYHFFLCLTHGENSQLMPWVDKQEACVRQRHRIRSWFAVAVSFEKTLVIKSSRGCSAQKRTKQ